MKIGLRLALTTFVALLLGCDAQAPPAPQAVAPPAVAPPPVAPPLTPPGAIAPPAASTPAASTPGSATSTVSVASLPLTSDFVQAGEKLEKIGLKLIGEYASAARSVGHAAGASLGQGEAGAASYEKELAAYTQRIEAVYKDFQEARQKCPSTPGVVAYEKFIQTYVEYTRSTKTKVEQPILAILRDQSLDRAQKVAKIQAIFAPIVAEDQAAQAPLPDATLALLGEHSEFATRKARGK
jgi:hypothetical protein